MLQYEGFFVWFFACLVFAIMFGIPTIIGGIGVFIRGNILSNYHYKKMIKAETEYEKLEKISKDEYNEWTIERRMEYRDKLHELKQVSLHEKEIHHKYRYKDSFFNTLLIGSDNTAFEMIVTFVGGIVKFIAVGFFVFSFIIPFIKKSDYNDALKYYNNKESIKIEREQVAHPTRNYILEQETYNETLRKSYYFTDEFKNNDDNFIDTELLWAKLCDNINLKRTMDGVK